MAELLLSLALMGQVSCDKCDTCVTHTVTTTTVKSNVLTVPATSYVVGIPVRSYVEVQTPVCVYTKVKPLRLKRGLFGRLFVK
jgi:hypothetical protein